LVPQNAKIWSANVYNWALDHAFIFLLFFFRTQSFIYLVFLFNFFIVVWKLCFINFSFYMLYILYSTFNINFFFS
jgi:hypothetical protein